MEMKWTFDQVWETQLETRTGPDLPLGALSILFLASAPSFERSMLCVCGVICSNPKCTDTIQITRIIRAYHTPHHNIDLSKIDSVAYNKTDSATSGNLWRSFLKVKTGSGYKVKLLRFYPQKVLCSESLVK